jgi:hypothetical protein
MEEAAARGRPLITPGSHRLEVAMFTKAAARTAAWRAVLVGLLVGLTACGGADPDTSEPPATDRESPSATVSTSPGATHRVEVRLTAIRGAEGDVVAGILYRGKNLPEAFLVKNVVGGFGAEVDDDPFSLVATINDGSTGMIPFLEGPPADVSPGAYFLMMWRGPSLGPYSKWVPAAEPGLTGCPAQLEVGDGAVTKVAVTGFPDQPEPLDLETMRPCLR